MYANLADRLRNVNDLALRLNTQEGRFYYSKWLSGKREKKKPTLSVMEMGGDRANREQSDNARCWWKKSMSLSKNSLLSICPIGIKTMLGKDVCSSPA